MEASLFHEQGGRHHDGRDGIGGSSDGSNTGSGGSRGLVITLQDFVSAAQPPADTTGATNSDCSVRVSSFSSARSDVLQFATGHLF